MYHGLHAALDKEGFGNGENESEAEGRRRFSCPTCKRRNWSSIETFRTHKLACRPGPQKAALQQCNDCGAAFSTQACLDQHRVHCLRNQQMGPYLAVRWK